MTDREHGVQRQLGRGRHRYCWSGSELAAVNSEPGLGWIRDIIGSIINIGAVFPSGIDKWIGSEADLYLIQW
jgi:hypothetical protein